MEILTAKPNFVAATVPGWQQQMKLAIRDVQTLLRRLNLPALDSPAWPDDISGSSAFRSQNEIGGAITRPEAVSMAAARFSTFVPEPYLSRIEPGNCHDPLLLQVLPQAAEIEPVAGFSSDPLAEREAQRLPGMLQKYAGRVLLVLTGACAVHCRYCFRREYPYQDAPKSIEHWRPVISEIAADSTISEVIRSGGDPLTLVDETLAAWVEELRQIAHVRRLRIHTRLPIMIPQRVTDDLLDWLASWPHAVALVVHVNHPREIDGEVATALARLRQVPRLQLLNQSVLLRGVNDSAATLRELSEGLFEVGVLPYYLHQLDAIAGAAHFAVPAETGLALIDQLQQSLPGYLVPKYVQEIPHALSKIEVAKVAGTLRVPSW